MFLYLLIGYYLLINETRWQLNRIVATLYDISIKFQIDQNVIFGIKNSLTF